ncbi:MAG: signal peptide peptidase SppA [Bacteroidota bacterium]|nr:signal peptide peptidase SppA [Candidatus Kapabacteria bacterium]MDW8074192.1 signal peptide peptidase SppA [Bacteroidota bacterium]
MAMQMSAPMSPQRQRPRWWIPLVILAALFAGMVLGIVLLIGIFIAALSSAGSLSVSSDEDVEVREHTLLVLNFPSGVREQQYPSGLSFSETATPSLLDVLSAIRYAARDKKVDGILLRRCRGVGLAQAREIRQELLEFKKSGKRIYAFLDGGNEADYYLASVADSIIVAPLAMIEFNGFGVTAPFFKNLSDKLGISWTVIQREEYKSAGEQFSRTGFSEPARQELRQVLEQQYQVFVNDIARSRGIPPATIEQLLSRGLYQAEEFVQHGLAHAIATEQQVRDMLRRWTQGTDTTKPLRLVGPARYAQYARQQTSKSVEREKAIAIVAAVGPIRSGKRDGQAEEIASRSFCQDIRKAADDTTVKAIIVRIESPGGSAQASEEIWHELQRARQKKPVYASMSTVAASGGYYIASACDTIIAAPETVTGSIGVIAAIPNFSKLMNSIGVTFDTVATSPSASSFSGVLPMQPSERKMLERMIDTIYARFLERVALGRKRSVEAIREVARGRVWTGQAAHEKGLVDMLGGLTDAIELAKRRVGIAPDKRPRLKFYPEKEDLATVLLRMLRNLSGEEDDENMQRLAWLVLQQPWKHVVRWIVASPEHRELKHALKMVHLAQRERLLMVMPQPLPQW